MAGILETKSTFWVESIVEEMWKFEPSARRTRPKWVRQYEIMWKKSQKNSSTRVVTEVVDMEKKYGWPAAIAKWRAQWNKRSPMQQPVEGKLPAANYRKANKQYFKLQ